MNFSASLTDVLEDCYSNRKVVGSTMREVFAILAIKMRVSTPTSIGEFVPSNEPAAK